MKGVPFPVMYPVVLASVNLIFYFLVTIVLQTEAELLAEKRCVAHLTGEVNVVIFSPLLPSVNNIRVIFICYALFYLFFRESLFVIYPRIRCFLERCNTLILSFNMKNSYESCQNAVQRDT